MDNTEKAPPELRPCPCCSFSPQWNQDSNCFGASVPGWQIRCDKCGLQTCWWHSFEEAIEHWNTRASSPAAEAKCVGETEVRAKVWQQAIELATKVRLVKLSAVDDALANYDEYASIRLGHEVDGVTRVIETLQAAASNIAKEPPKASYSTDLPDALATEIKELIESCMCAEPSGDCEETEPLHLPDLYNGIRELLRTTTTAIAAELKRYRFGEFDGPWLLESDVVELLAKHCSPVSSDAVSRAAVMQIVDVCTCESGPEWRSVDMRHHRLNCQKHLATMVRTIPAVQPVAAEQSKEQK